MLNAINSSCCIFLILQNETTLNGKNAMIDVGEGTIKGLKAPDGDYFMYLGIPYAKVDESNYFGVSNLFNLLIIITRLKNNKLSIVMKMMPLKILLL